MEVFVTIQYDFYPDHPYPELSERVKHIQVGVFSTLEAAKRFFEEPFDKEQEDSANPRKIKWYDREDHSSTYDIGGDGNEVLIRKLIVDAPACGGRSEWHGESSE
jgi:hypothetical protein